MKEQTPITARNIIDENLNSINGLAFESVKHYAESGRVSGSLLLAIEKSMEQYAQTKVLEALEMVEEEEIELKIDSIPYYGSCTTEYREGFRDGIDWYKEETKQK